jgi:hypothetical protein
MYLAMWRKRMWLENVWRFWEVRGLGAGAGRRREAIP